MLRVEELLVRRQLPRLGFHVGQCRGLLTIKKFTRPEVGAREPASPKAKAASAAVDDNAAAAAPKDVSASSPVRLAKRIAMSGLCSRREAEKRIRSFDVTVNGQVVADVATTVDVEQDEVAVDGRVLSKTQKAKVWMAHKMTGVRLQQRRRSNGGRRWTNADTCGCGH